jgi:hypothetical protein
MAQLKSSRSVGESISIDETRGVYETVLEAHGTPLILVLPSYACGVGKECGISVRSKRASFVTMAIRIRDGSLLQNCSHSLTKIILISILLAASPDHA